MQNILITLFFIMTLLPVHAQVSTDSTAEMATDTIGWHLCNNNISDSPTKRKGFFRKLGNGIKTLIRNFSEVDTNYIEPQKYNYTLMLQNTNTYESYWLRSAKGNSFKFSPQPAVKLGPYIGWRWVFLGYTVDLLHLNSDNRRTEFDLSLYSSQFGIDLFYRKTGDDYRVSRVRMDAANTINTDNMRGIEFDGINVSITGLNLYYIFNHKRFSYPAAFSQSTIQRRSCGSFLCGLGYTKHSLSVDWEKLYSLVANNLGEDIAQKYMDSELKLTKVKYTDLSVSCGYAYNLVFAHNWLASASVSMAVGYKSATSNDNHGLFSFKEFSFKNFNLDGVGRFGIVWNNMKMYYGASAILHTYNYSKAKFSTNTIFGSINLYVGFNFGRKKEYK